MPADYEADSPLTPLGLQLVSTDTLRAELNQPAQPWCGEAAAWLFLVWLFVPFMLASFLFGPATFAMSEAMNGNSDFLKVVAGLLLAICLGVIPLQAVVLNCYAVFSAEAWWFRAVVLLANVLPLSLAGIGGMYVAFLLDQVPIGVEAKENAVRYFCALPSIVLAAQLPFWLMRIFRGWQFVRILPADPEGQPVSDEPAGRQSLSILHLLVATAVVAVCLGLIRGAPLEALEGAWVLWLLLGVFSSIAFVFSLVSLVYIILFTRIKSRLLYWALAVGVPALIDLVIFVVVAFFIWGLYWDEIEEVGFSTLMFSTIGLTYIVGLTSCLWLLRAHGWKIAPVRTS